jgi:succinate dehydrogenase/fumarate reductase flavoprotein subunit
LVLGNALVARLYHALLQRGVPVWREVTVRALLRDSGRVGAVRLHVGAGEHVVTARRAVILAGGGFPADAEWRSRWLPALTSPHTPAAPGCYGSSMRLALDVGAVLGEPGEDNALWFPSSIVRRRDGSTAVYPHIVLDRAKPGLIAVNAAGRRFCNEAVSYHEFTRAMLRSGAVPAWLVCDRRFIGRYGLGLIRPRSLSLGREIARGYLHTAPAIAALAQAIGVDAAGLAETVAANNGFARSGVDTLFGKGGNAYDRAGGDAEHAPNPCLGPIDRPPFYAVPVVPTPLGTSLGLRCNAAAQVCDATDAPISGLYACGNDMHSVFAGEYPGAGAQIGAAMTFAYIAVRHAIGVADSRAAAS